MGIIQILLGTTPPGGQIVTDNLLVHYDAGDTDSYPGTGTDLFDLSGNGYDATISGATYSSNNGGEFDFDGTNDKINCGTGFNPDISGANEFSIETWVKINSSQVDAVANIYGNLTYPTPQSGINMEVEYGVSPVEWGFVGGATGNNGIGWIIDSDRNSFPLDEYIQLVAIRKYDAGTTENTIEYYVNGVLDRTVSTTGLNLSTGQIYESAEAFNLGAGFYYDGGAASRFFTGKIAVCRIYSAALSAGEVEQNFDAQKTRFGL